MIQASVGTVFGIELIQQQQQQLSFLTTTSLTLPKAADSLLILWRVNDFKEKARELKTTLCGQSLQEEIKSYTGQISLEPGVRDVHFKETENKTWTGQRESRLEITDPGRPGNTKTTLRAPSMRDEIENCSRQIESRSTVRIRIITILLTAHDFCVCYLHPPTRHPESKTPL